MRKIKLNFTEYIDAITEARLLKNIRAHRVPSGICADVTHCKSGLWNCIDCKHFVPEVEQLLYFNEQIIAWQEKADGFSKDKQRYDNFSDILLKFSKIVERLEEKLYKESKKNLPVELQKQQELKKQESINKVLRAIADISGEGRKVTISTLMEFTGLSRSTFAKPHIRELLVDYEYAQKGADSGSKGKKKTKKSSNKDKTIAELRVRHAELERKCELLRG